VATDLPPSREPHRLRARGAPARRLEPIADGYQQRGTFTSVEPLQRTADVTGDVLDFWSEASGQEQGWSLFAPGMPPYSVFPAVRVFTSPTARVTPCCHSSSGRQTEPAAPRARSSTTGSSTSRYSSSIRCGSSRAEEVAWRYSPDPTEAGAKISDRATEGVPRISRLRAAVRGCDSRVPRVAVVLKEYRAAHSERGANRSK